MDVPIGHHTNTAAADADLLLGLVEFIPESGENRGATGGVLHHPPVPQSVEDLGATANGSWDR